VHGRTEGPAPSHGPSYDLGRLSFELAAPPLAEVDCPEVAHNGSQGPRRSVPHARRAFGRGGSCRQYADATTATDGRLPSSALPAIEICASGLRRELAQILKPAPRRPRLEPTLRRLLPMCFPIELHRAGNFSNCLKRVVGATGIEPVTPTMST
jgi:hypothetical protein